MTKPKEEKKDETKNKLAGGGEGETEIEVKTDPVEVPEGETKDVIEQPEVGVGSEVGLVNEALVETVIRVLGKTLALITKIPELDFDEAETEQLKNLWSPIVPSFSPTTMAIVGTVVIAGGKLGIYMSKRPKKGLPTAKEAASTEESLEKEWKGD